MDEDVSLHSSGLAFRFFHPLFVVAISEVRLPVHKQPREKRVRNVVYISCGVVMIISMLWAGLAGFLNKPIFIPEAFAIEAFAVSWLVKGEAEHTLVRVAHRLFPHQRD